VGCQKLGPTAHASAHRRRAGNSRGAREPYSIWGKQTLSPSTIGSIQERAGKVCAGHWRLRTLSIPGVQVAPVVDASSSQSRSDVLVILLSAVLVLTGLQWLALVPRQPSVEEPDGIEVLYVNKDLPKRAITEMRWCDNEARQCFQCYTCLHSMRRSRRF
jgi:Cofactor assembly of complex C subunit B, CCB2/CCB4